MFKVNETYYGEAGPHEGHTIHVIAVKSYPETPFEQAEADSVTARCADCDVTWTFPDLPEMVHEDRR